MSGKSAHLRSHSHSHSRSSSRSHRRRHLGDYGGFGDLGFFFLIPLAAAVAPIVGAAVGGAALQANQDKEAVQSAQAAVTQLQAQQAPPPVAAPPPKPKTFLDQVSALNWKKWAPIGGAGLLVILGLIFALSPKEGAE